MAGYSCYLPFDFESGFSFRDLLSVGVKEARKGFLVHAHAQSTQAITKMHASAESVLKSVHRKLMLRKIARTGNKICEKHLYLARKFAQ